MGGGGFGAADAAEKQDKKPDEDEMSNWTTRSAVLTPGDRVEFKFKLKAGETLMASATSDAFDPALSIQNSKGAELAKNDDRQEGDQSPFVIYRAKSEGDFLLKVLSYRSVSGGKFAVKFRTVTAMDAPLGEKEQPAVFQRRDGGYSFVTYRLECKKGKIYDVRPPVFTFGRGQRTSGAFRRTIGPSGVDAQDFELVPAPGSSQVFKALADGDFYFQHDYYYGSETVLAMSSIREVSVQNVPTNGVMKFESEPQELKIFEFEATAGQVIRTILGGERQAMVVSSQASETTRRENGDGDTWGNNRYWLWFKPFRHNNGDVVRVFHASGTVRVAVRSGASAKHEGEIKNAEGLAEWNSGKAMNERLAIGESKLYLLKSSKSELMKVRASASLFEPKMEIFRLNGELANSLMDRNSHAPGDDLYFPDAGMFIVRLSCDGHGGSGDFVMGREVLQPKPYMPSSTVELNLDGQNFGLFAVPLEAGKRYQLTYEHKGSGMRVDLLDDEGQFIPSVTVRFDQVEVHYFVPTRSGRHRLWLRGAPGKWRFRFEQHVAPKVG